MTIPAIENKPIHYTIASLPEGADALLLGKMAMESARPLLHVVKDDAAMATFCDAAKFFSPGLDILCFPAWDCLPYDRISPNPNILSRRLEILSRLAAAREKGQRLVVTTANALLQRIPEWEMIYESILQLKTGDEIKRDRIVSYLEKNGYQRSGTATERGEYAIRGSIIDIFPSDSDLAVRMDFMGDTLEDMRRFDPLSQISQAKIERIDLAPASEVIFSAETIERFKDNYRKIFGAALGDPLFEAVADGRKYAGFEHWLPLFYDKLDSLFDYLPEAAVSFGFELNAIIEARLENITEYYQARQDYAKLNAKTGEIYKALPPDALYLSEKELAEILNGRTQIDISQFKVEGKNVIDAGFKTADNYFLKSKELLKSPFQILQEDLAQKKRFYIACFSEGSKSRIEYLLKEHDIVFRHSPNFPKGEIIGESSRGISGSPYSLQVNSGGDVIGIFILPLESGFQNTEFTILSEQDLLGQKILRAAKKKNRPEKFLAESYNFSVGDFVVHKEHGIGKFEGLETLTVSGTPHDCLKLVYDGGDKLYLPVENIDVISRYGSADSFTVVDKLGGVSWQNRKARLKERIKLAAEEIIRVAAARAIKTSEPIIPPEGLYNEFCARFPFNETEDQLRSIEDVEKDLASGHPMNRLICGDVGFGKTEVAMRAAFIALGERVSGIRNGIGGQVAVITPTTLLARQHYKNFRERFSGFPVNIRQLSRMVTAREASEVKAALKEGEVDIVIGTHALLAKNVHFQNLNLLIVDEEQHFGVAQKEHIKKLQADIHVLTLSATPIPRTLQMSLTGIRDLSLIASPPVDRIAVRTYVMPYDSVVIREAIMRERGRGGRTFYVCPRIKDLDIVHGQLKVIVPELKLAVAHGQLKPAELDELMNDFYDGKYDILLSTTIIESGIDIPTANTLIVHRSDMFGLAQLYQLRGRVGRSNIRAYAYFTLAHNRMVSGDATKRLEVMQKLDSLGAGFTLATYDMDIRGFGNLLGDEQSGNIKEVGVELYEQMLREAIEELKATESVERRKLEEKNYSPQINIGLSVLIPEHYIEDLNLRLGLYRRIGAVESNEAIESIAAEMVDRFGALPEEVEHLLEVMKIKLLCKQAGIEKIDAGPKGAVITFHKNQFQRPDALIKYISENINSVKLRADHKLVFLDQDWEKIESRVKGVRKSIDTITKLAA